MIAIDPSARTSCARVETWTPMYCMKKATIQKAIASQYHSMSMSSVSASVLDRKPPKARPMASVRALMPP